MKTNRSHKSGESPLNNECFRQAASGAVCRQIKARYIAADCLWRLLIGGMRDHWVHYVNGYEIYCEIFYENRYEIHYEVHYEIHFVSQLEVH